MFDSKKTKKALLEDLEVLRARVAELERARPEHKEAEEVRRQSEEKYSELVGELLDVVFEIDGQGRWVYLSPVVKELLGYDADELLGKSYADILLAEDAERVRNDREKWSDKFDYESRFLHKNGDIVFVRWRGRPSRDKKGKLLSIRGALRDITERKRTEEELKQYQFMVESAHDAIYFKDLKGRYVIANNKTLEAFGLSRERVMGKSDDEIMPNKAEARKNIEDDRLVFKTGKLTEITKHMTDIDGKERWFEAIKVPQFNDKGNIIGLVGIARDVTEHRKAEEALHDKTRALDAIITNLKQGIAYLDENDTIIYLNQQCADLFGLKYEDVFQKNIYGFHRPKKRGAVRALIKEFKEGKQSLNVVETVGNKVVDSTFHRIQDGDGNYQGILMSAVDITERKKAEEALQESEERYHTLFESSRDGIAIANLKGFIAECNQAYADMLGYSREGLKKIRYQDITPSKWHAFNEKIFQGVMEHGYSDVFEKEYIRKDGTVFPVALHTWRVDDKDGNPVGVGSIVRDITERKRADEALQKARDELEIRVEQRTADLARANEELQNEVNERKKAEGKLLIYQEQLRSLASELSLAEERLRRRIAIDVHDHISQNLAISKIKLESLAESASSAKFAGALEEIRDLVAQTIESMRSLTFELSPPVLYELGFEAAVEWLVRQIRQQHGLSAEFRDDGRTKPLDDDTRVLLFQAVRELLINVAKHARARTVTVLTRRVNDKIQVSVEDDGVGFDVSQTDSHDYKTGGFGLFSIRERLDHVGGYIDIDSESGRGTRVTLVAPISHKKENGKERGR